MKQFNFTENDYKSLVKNGFNSICSNSVYSISIIKGTFSNEIFYKFIISCVLYKSKDGKIVNIVPVWWDMQTNTACLDVENDFEFETFKKYFIEYAKNI